MSSVRQGRYKRLGDTLLQAYGGDRPQNWLAEKTFVSQEAVHYWLTGQCRPTPSHLGHIAVLLNLKPDKLATLAEYDDDPNALDKVFAAYKFAYSSSNGKNGDKR